MADLIYLDNKCIRCKDQNLINLAVNNEYSYPRGLYKIDCDGLSCACIKCRRIYIACNTCSDPEAFKEEVKYNRQSLDETKSHRP